jgi:hypothetical protein
MMADWKRACEKRFAILSMRVAATYMFAMIITFPLHLRRFVGEPGVGEPPTPVGRIAPHVAVEPNDVDAAAALAIGRARVQAARQ